ncbi:MAG TPA: alkaline phosphatase family protein [Candidatus Cybelea sp.]|nr:alkaline phosphatase family protein [Candidatus Cybelea sp.]
MNSSKYRSCARLIFGVLAFCLAFAMLASTVESQTFPRYDHVFLIIMENEDYNQVIGNQYAPILNALAQDYGLATNYSGVADPSEPNYVAMLGGDFFGINSDDPYWFPGHTVSAGNLLSQLEGAGKTWRGYFQSMPYPGYRGYCYPDKCNGIPDSDTQYVSKHNGIVNFASLQTPTELAKMFPIAQLSADLVSGALPNFSYIVPNECNDMHGAPPWCVDSDNTGTLQQSWLIAQGDKYVGHLVNQITSSSTWPTGDNAIVIVFDEGNTASARIAAIVVANHGPRGITDKTSYNHYSMLASLQQAFGLGCLVNSCTANPMMNLFAITGSTSIPTLPPPYNFPTTTDTISAQGAGKAAAQVSLTGAGWSVVPSYSFGSIDNNLTGVSAAAANDAWAVGAYYPSSSNILATLAEHFDGTRWTAYPLPKVGVEENVLLAVSMPSTGAAWAVGYYVSGKFQQQTLIEHFDGTVWSVVPSPSPGALQNILYGVAAISDSDVWAVGAEQDANELWHTLTEHWNGSVWSVVNAVDAGSTGNQFYAVKALASNNVYAVGQQTGAGFPNQALIEHWNGTAWSVVSSPADGSASALPLGVTATASSLTLAGEQETDNAPYTSYVAAGAPGAQSIQTTPNAGTGENDLFAAATAADGSTWVVGWDIDTATGNHDPLILQGVNGAWSLVSSPSLGKGTDTGFAAITAIPGGGLWAVGVTALAKGNYATLIEYHP